MGDGGELRNRKEGLRLLQYIIKMADLLWESFIVSMFTCYRFSTEKKGAIIIVDVRREGETKIPNKC